ncbi:MAG: Trm112 family protein [Chloroflexota bacterium]|nr:Trm112 family protein [Chloroflexota bacterium]MDE2891865.1 Trm112 family protein [Chloroflexota bacterium]
MRRELVDQLVCPVTRDPLKLEVTREDENGNVLEGALVSERINFRYPIEDGIPNLLPPDLQRRAEDEV